MESKELRIGNYISRPDLGCHTYRIEQILELGLKVKTTGPIKVICDYKDLIPIQLTEQWLIDFGFSRIDEIVSRDYVYTIYFGGTEFELFLNPKNGKIRFRNSPIEIEVKYVHRLQNLYSTITEEELIIKTNDKL
jgi:hypothetical protein